MRSGRPTFLMVIGIASSVLVCGSPALAQFPWAASNEGGSGQRIILSFGNDQFIPKGIIAASTGARFQSDFTGLRFLDEASVIILANTAFAQLPPLLQSSLVQWVELGGSLLVTGGDSAFGFGAYFGTPIGSVLPLRPRETDKLGHPFSPTLVVNPGHPVFAGVTGATMANFNETSLAGDATLLLEYRGTGKASFGGAGAVGVTGGGRTFITTVNPTTGQAQVTLGTAAQSAAGVVTNPVTGAVVPASPGAGIATPAGTGGAAASGTLPGVTSGGQPFDPGFGSEGGIQGGGRPVFPLIAERRQGQGLVLAIALDMSATGEWQDRDNLTINAVRYLLDQSKLPLSR